MKRARQLLHLENLFESPELQRTQEGELANADNQKLISDH